MLAMEVRHNLLIFFSSAQDTFKFNILVFKQKHINFFFIHIVLNLFLNPSEVDISDETKTKRYVQNILLLINLSNTLVNLSYIQNNGM